MSAASDPVGIEEAIVPTGRILSDASYDRRRHAVHVGTAMALVAVQLFFYLDTVVGSPLLPGTWTQFQAAFQVDLLFSIATVAAIAVLPMYDPALVRRLVLQPGGISTGLLHAGIFLLGGIVLSVGYLALNGIVVPVGTVDSTVALQGAIEFGVFVAVGEELLFRVAFTIWFRGRATQAFMASAPFALFHAWAYSVGPGGTLESAMTIAGNLAFAGLFGLLLWAVYRLWGIMASMGLHAGWDVGVSSSAALHVTPHLFGVALGMV